MNNPTPSPENNRQGSGISGFVQKIGLSAGLLLAACGGSGTGSRGSAAPSNPNTVPVSTANVELEQTGPDRVRVRVREIQNETRTLVVTISFPNATVSSQLAPGGNDVLTAPKVVGPISATNPTNGNEIHIIIDDLNGNQAGMGTFDPDNIPANGVLTGQVTVLGQ